MQNLCRDSLGIAYYRGEGVTRDLITSHKWLNLSKVAGYARATEFLEYVSTEMDYHQIRAAIIMAQEFSVGSQSPNKTNVSDGVRQRLMYTLASVEVEVNSSIEWSLGSEVYAALQPVTRALLIKAETEHCSRRDGSDLSAAFLFAKAFENEFNICVKKPIVSSLLERGHTLYPIKGEWKLIRGGSGNDRLTPGQIVHFIQHDPLVRTIVSKHVSNVNELVQRCERLIELRNEIVHGASTVECAERLRESLLGKDNVFSILDGPLL